MTDQDGKSLDDYQDEVKRWRASMGTKDVTLLVQVAGAAGELAGESLQSAVKLQDGRGDGLDHEAKIKDGMGDAMIYMMGACDLLGCTLMECFEMAWSGVQLRTHETWEADKNTYAQRVESADPASGNSPHHFQTPTVHDYPGPESEFGDGPR